MVPLVFVSASIMNQVWLLWANLGIYQGNCIQEEGWPETTLHLAEKRRTILAQIGLFDRHTYSCVNLVFMREICVPNCPSFFPFANFATRI